MRELTASETISVGGGDEEAYPGEFGSPAVSLPGVEVNPPAGYGGMSASTQAGLDGLAGAAGAFFGGPAAGLGALGVWLYYFGFAREGTPSGSNPDAPRPPISPEEYVPLNLGF